MSKIVKQTEWKFKRERKLWTLSSAVADGVLDEAPLPVFIIEVPMSQKR